MKIVLKGLKITLEIESMEVEGEESPSAPNNFAEINHIMNVVDTIAAQVKIVVQSNEELKETINLKLS